MTWFVLIVAVSFIVTWLVLLAVVTDYKEKMFIMEKELDVLRARLKSCETKLQNTVSFEPL